jgi:hypothetical protein
MKPGISSLTDFEGFILLIALRTSTSEIGAWDKNSEECRGGRGPKGNSYYKLVESA